MGPFELLRQTLLGYYLDAISIKKWKCCNLKLTVLLRCVVSNSRRNNNDVNGTRGSTEGPLSLIYVLLNLKCMQTNHHECETLWWGHISLSDLQWVKATVVFSF